MAERKSGPVKPPVIDLKAREAAQTPEAEATPTPPRATPPGRSASGRFAKADASETAASETPGVSEAQAEAEGVPPAADSPAAAAPAESPTEPAGPAGERPAAVAESPTEPARPAEERPAAARPGGDGPAAAPSAGDRPAEEVPPPLPPRPAARLAMPWSAISIAAGAGALLGVGLAYLLANWVALPQQAPRYADPTTPLSELSDRLLALDARVASLEETTIDTRVAADATLVQLDTTTTALRQEIDDVRRAMPAPQPAADLSGLEQQLQTLESRVSAIGAGVSSADATRFAENLVSLEQKLARIEAGFAQLDSRFGAGDTAVTALRNDIEEVKAALAAQSRTLGGTAIGPAVKLPLIVSGLEAAFASGRAYASELDGLRALLPDLAVPATLTQRAATGLPRPDALLARFEDRLPDILTGRTGESTGDWTKDALEWAKALLALRPAEEREGDTPEAIVSRLEGAMQRRDFLAAAALLAQLPPAMRSAAGDVGTDIATLAEAETFITRLRSEALAPPEAPAAPAQAEPAT